MRLTAEDLAANPRLRRAVSDAAAERHADGHGGGRIDWDGI